MRLSTKLALLLLWLFISNIPILWGFISADPFVFSGFVLNPIDGASYYAKMQQGFVGNWYFQLPFTSEQNSPAIIFIFYLLLGQISRFFGCSIVFIFQLVRISLSVLLFFVITSFLQNIFKKNGKELKFALLSMLFGGGWGWLYLAGKELPADFWVAEAYPFLSSFSNPHFILTLVCMIGILNLVLKENRLKMDFLAVILYGLVLSSISPFATLLMGVIVLIFFAANSEFCNKTNILFLLCLGLGSAPFSIYQFVVVRNDPVLRIWNEQNITPTPVPLNLILSFSPFIFAVLYYLYLIFIRKQALSKSTYLLLIWVTVVLLFVFIPINLQRRFLVGFYIPVVILFWQVMEEINTKFFTQKIYPYIIITVLISNFIIYAGIISAIMDKNENIFIASELIDAVQYIESTGKGSVIILSDQSSSLWVPAYSINRVFHAHPFETIAFEDKANYFEEFWSGTYSYEEQKDFLNKHNISFILENNEYPGEFLKTGQSAFPTLFENEKFTVFGVSE
ncbi:MAG: hypothetical protein CVU39_02795 [Chloroflexi bacterium HGW-Chloroflexi-10]|nr:MAG: hypothetical protein CVU39_02795 [Chloroflexi bacterium HGW-Chloroflexi-10]